MGQTPFSLSADDSHANLLPLNVKHFVEKLHGPEQISLSRAKWLSAKSEPAENEASCEPFAR